MVRIILTALLALALARPAQLMGAARDSTITPALKALYHLSLDGLATSVTHPQLRRHWLLIGLGTLAAFPLDAEVQQRAGELLPPVLARLGDDWGGSWAVLAILPGVYLADRARATAAPEAHRRLTFAATSLLAVGVTTWTLKWVVGRQRPNGRSSRSFPSGHTSAAFGVAEVVRQLYGSRLAAPIYALATVTGISRIHDNKHYLSDVVAGAGLGMGLVRGFALAQRRTGRLTVTRIRLTPGSAEISMSFGAVPAAINPFMR